MGWCIQKQNYSTRTTIIVTISIKILAVSFCKYILDNTKWDKIIEVIAKNSYLEESKTLFEKEKDNQKPNLHFRAVVHRPNLYYSKISKRKLKKEYTISSGTKKKYNFLETELNFPFRRAD